MPANTHTYTYVVLIAFACLQPYIEALREELQSVQNAQAVIQQEAVSNACMYVSSCMLLRIYVDV